MAHTRLSSRRFGSRPEEWSSSSLFHPFSLSLSLRNISSPHWNPCTRRKCKRMRSQRCGSQWRRSSHLSSLTRWAPPRTCAPRVLPISMDAPMTDRSRLFPDYVPHNSPPILLSRWRERDGRSRFFPDRKRCAYTRVIVAICAGFAVTLIRSKQRAKGNGRKPWSRLIPFIEHEEEREGEREGGRQVSMNRAQSGSSTGETHGLDKVNAGRVFTFSSIESPLM